MAHRVSIRFLMIAATAFVSVSAPANAALVISDAPTANVTCQTVAFESCAATAANAVLNVHDLEAMLRHGNVTVSVGSDAADLIVSSPLQWTSRSTLNIGASRSLIVDVPITVTGPGALSMGVSTGPIGGLSFGPKGSITFWDLSSSLQISGVSYTLVDSITALAKAIAANPARDYALARSYDASHDGIYKTAPVMAVSYTVEGLGNTVSNYTEVCSTTGCSPGLFGTNTGTLRDIRLTNASVTDRTGQNSASLFASDNVGAIVGAHVSGMLKVTSGAPDAWAAGGLAGYNYGQIVGSAAVITISVASPLNTQIGGLSGVNSGTVRNSWATGSLAVGTGSVAASLGGLVGANDTGALVERSWAAVHITDDGGMDGGLVGENGGAIRASHAAVKLTFKANYWRPDFGGLVGAQWSGGSIDISYATGSISAGAMRAGGLVGECDAGKISRSFADVTVHNNMADGMSVAGGLIGLLGGPCGLADVYSTGAVIGEIAGANLGGLIGYAETGANVARAYATGAVRAEEVSSAGGFVCVDQTSGGMTDAYWDTTTTGVDTATCTGSDSGVTPLTTSQLQSKLPAGFSPTVWVQNPSINNGFPYLIANPPPK